MITITEEIIKKLVDNLWEWGFLVASIRIDKEQEPYYLVCDLIEDLNRVSKSMLNDHYRLNDNPDLKHFNQIVKKITWWFKVLKGHYREDNDWGGYIGFNNNDFKKMFLKMKEMKEMKYKKNVL